MLAKESEIDFSIFRWWQLSTANPVAAVATGSDLKITAAAVVGLLPKPKPGPEPEPGPMHLLQLGLEHQQRPRDLRQYQFALRLLLRWPPAAQRLQLSQR